MARSISDIYNLLSFIIRKQKNVYISIPEAMSALDSGQLDAYSVYWKAYGVDQTIHDALQPFKVYQQFTSDAVGFVTYNADYLHLLAGVFTIIGSTINKVRFVQTDEFPDAITSQLRPVSLSRPIATDQNIGFQLYPQSSQSGAYNYMRRPISPVYAYTQVGRTITYNPLGSTQIEFLDIYVNNIISKTLKYFGVNMDEDKIVQFGEMLDKETT
jgi:hypothetical protein